MVVFRRPPVHVYRRLSWNHPTSHMGPLARANAQASEGCHDPAVAGSDTMCAGGLRECAARTLVRGAAGLWAGMSNPSASSSQHHRLVDGCGARKGVTLSRLVPMELFRQAPLSPLLRAPSWPQRIPAQTLEALPLHL